MFNLNKSHFGYYQVGNYKTFSKLEALELYQKTGKDFTWHFNDEVYGSCDWTKEPAESMQELYYRRAQQIREKYDYVILTYSGGADSHNALMAFVNARVKIDEIVSYTYYRAEGRRDTFINKEIFETAIPTIQRLKDTDPLYRDLKINEVDISDLGLDLFKNINVLDYQYYANSCISPWNTVKTFVREKIPYFKDLCQSRKVVFVHGGDKPTAISESKGKFYFQFMDMFDGAYHIARVQDLNRPEEHDELFYSTPDMPEIHIKQCHLIKNFLLNLTPPHAWAGEYASGLAYVRKIINKQVKTFHLTKDGLHHIIYPWFEPDVYNAPKVMSVLYSDRDRWIFEHPDLAPTYNMYIKGMIEKFGPEWLHQQKEKGTSWVRKMYSRSYCLTP